MVRVRTYWSALVLPKLEYSGYAVTLSRRCELVLYGYGVPTVLKPKFLPNYPYQVHHLNLSFQRKNSATRPAIESRTSIIKDLINDLMF